MTPAYESADRTTSAAVGRETMPDPAADPMSKRRFLKLMAGAIAGAGTAAVVADPPGAEANYTVGNPDTVDTSLTVQGNLKVGPTSQSGIGVGSPSPASYSSIRVNGELHNGDTVVIDANGVGRQSCYAPGPEVLPLPGAAVGSWGLARTTSWGAHGQRSWGQVRTSTGTWRRVASFTWGALSAYSWEQVKSL